MYKQLLSLGKSIYFCSN